MAELLIVCLAVLGTSACVVQGTGNDRPANAAGPSHQRPEPIEIDRARARIVEFPAGEGALREVRLETGLHEVSVFAQIKGSRGAEGRPADDFSSDAAEPIARLTINEGARRVVHVADLSRNGLDQCCADNFQELQIKFRDLNPFNPAKVAVAATYDKPIAVSPSNGAEQYTARTLARAGEDDFVDPGVELLDVDAMNWAPRPMAYVARRALGIASPGAAYVAATPEGSALQLAPDLDLSDASQLVFIMPACAKPVNINLRFQSSRGTQLLRRQMDRAVVTWLGSDQLVSINLDVARRELGLSPRDRKLELFEFIGIFASSPTEAFACKPLRSVRAVASGAAAGPVAEVRFPMVVELLPGGLKVMRIQQTSMRDEANWGHVLRRLEISAVRSDIDVEVSGIDVMSIDLVTPPRSAAQPRVVETEGCAGELANLLALQQDDLRDLAAFCPVAARAYPIGRLAPPRARAPAVVEGIRFTPSGAAGVAAGRVAGAASADVQFERNEDRLDVTFETLGVSTLPRTIELRLKAAPDLLLSGPRGRFASDASTYVIEVPPGETPAVSVRRNPQVVELPSRHRIEIVQARETLQSGSSVRSGAPNRSGTGRTVDWSTPPWSGVGATSAETCRSMQGVDVCFEGVSPIFGHQGEALTISNAEQRPLRLALPTPFPLGGRTVFQLEAAALNEQGQSTRLAAPSNLVVETRSGRTLRVAFAPGDVVSLFPDDEVITKAEVVLTPPPTVAAVAVSRMNFVTLRRLNETGVSERLVRQREMTVHEPSGFQGAEGAVRAHINGETVVMNVGAGAVVPPVVAAWSHEINLRRADIVSIALRTKWTLPQQCKVADVEITVRSGPNRRVIERPLCGDALEIPAFEALPPEAKIDDTINAIDVRVLRRLNFVPVAVNGAIQIGVRLDQALKKIDSAVRGDVLTISGLPRGLDPHRGERGFIDELGSWLPAGHVVARGDEPLRIGTLPHPSVVIRAVRLTPMQNR